MSLLKLESDQSKSVTIVAQRHIRPLTVRVKNALRASMPWLVTAGVGVFIPILHFVIVPLALIAMVVLAIRELTTHYSFTVEKMECPHCANAYGETEFARLPMRLMCLQCRVASTLRETGSTVSTN